MDMAHCSRCLIPWTEFGGLYLMEIQRVLRLGGLWVLSGPPINSSASGGDGGVRVIARICPAPTVTTTAVPAPAAGTSSLQVAASHGRRPRASGPGDGQRKEEHRLDWCYLQDETNQHVFLHELHPVLHHQQERVRLGLQRRRRQGPPLQGRRKPARFWRSTAGSKGTIAAPAGTPDPMALFELPTTEWEDNTSVQIEAGSRL
ncbi:hypothetical protein ZWY2020_040166 [Hordeum vulgare]|nr:hypothetical protein ZWY2020_040166 [Hordeum vulgare]